MPIRSVTPADAPAIAAIYNHYIAHTSVTFEETLLSDADMLARIEALTRQHPWLVSVNENGAVQGYAYASPWKTRSAYRHTAEVTVYLHHDAARQGLGRALYTALLAELAQGGYHVALACIALPHEASVGLHEAMGFQKVAHFTEVGRKFDRWLDVGYWQKQLTPSA
jgi:L-amino acid N-acyltransferase YncA